MMQHADIIKGYGMVAEMMITGSLRQTLRFSDENFVSDKIRMKVNLNRTFRTLPAQVG